MPSARPTNDLGKLPWHASKFLVCNLRRFQGEVSLRVSPWGRKKGRAGDLGWGPHRDGSSEPPFSERPLRAGVDRPGRPAHWAPAAAARGSRLPLALAT